MVRIFPPFVMTMKQRWENDTKVGIFPPLSFIMTCNDCNLEQNPDHVPEKKYKYPTISSPPSLYKSLSYHQHLHPTNISLKSLPFDIFLHSVFSVLPQLPHFAFGIKVSYYTLISTFCHTLF